jgi:hypothetical protein
MATSSSSIMDVDDDSSTSSKKSSQVYQFFTYKNQRWHCNHCPKDFSDKATTTLWRYVNSFHSSLVKNQDQEGQEIIGSMDKYVTSSKKQVSFTI